MSLSIADLLTVEYLWLLTRHYLITSEMKTHSLVLYNTYNMFAMKKASFFLHTATFVRQNRLVKFTKDFGLQIKS